MKQFKIQNAYHTLEILTDNEFLTEEEQWELYKLRKFLRPHIDFQNEREDAVREKYSDSIDGEGNIHGEPAKQFLQDMHAISNLDIEIEAFDKPKIKMVKGINFKTIEPLEDFIEFLPPDE